jgi:putative transposase
VNRDFARSEPNRLWLTDITEHRTREGKVYCAVVLDAFSRRVVGWSIDSSQTSNLVVNALGMAIESRQAEGVMIHSDHGTQGELNRSSQHLTMMEVCKWCDGNSWQTGRPGRRCGRRAGRFRPVMLSASSGI